MASATVLHLTVSNYLTIPGLSDWNETHHNVNLGYQFDNKKSYEKQYLFKI